MPEAPPDDTTSDDPRTVRRDALQSLSLPRTSAKAFRRRRVPRWVFWGIVLGLLIGGVAAFHAATAVPAVEVAAVQRTSPIAALEITTANGYVVARTRASVASKTQGRLDRVLVDEGDLVETGQLLAEVEHDEQDAVVAQAEADLEQAKLAVPSSEASLREIEAALKTAETALEEKRASVAEAQAVLAESETSYTRTEDLVQREIASQSELDTARESRDVARARLQLAKTSLTTAETDLHRARAAVDVQKQQLAISKQSVSSAEAALDLAKATRANAFIKAPFAGMVLRREAEPGEVVSPANTGASGSKTAVVTLADFATLEIEVDVYERDIARIEVDTPCRIVLDAYPDRPLAGSVRLLRPTADRTRATIQVYVRFAKVPDFARPEMGARVSFFEKGADTLAPDELMLPHAAVTERGGKQGVFVVAGKTVRFHEVELGPVVEGADPDADRKVVSGVAPGDKVVLDPESSLEDGTPVTVADS